MLEIVELIRPADQGRTTPFYVMHPMVMLILSKAMPLQLPD